MSENKAKLMDITSWNFLNNIKQDDIVDLRWFAPAGVIMYILPFIFYILLASSLEEGHAHDLSWTIVAIHVVVGFLVLLDTIYYAGKSVLLQTLIIGFGTFNTFSLAGLSGVTIATNQDDHIIVYSLLSLALACFSNALMIALLFAMFHKSSVSWRNIDKNSDSD